MRRIRLGWAVTAALALGLSAVSMAAQAANWAIDPQHSEADFGIRHMGISTVHGSFRGISGVVRFEAGNPKSWSVEATIDVNSVDTGVPPRDKDLKSPEFFDTAKYPTMTFKSTSVRQDSSSGYLVQGDLTLHGVTKPVTLVLDSPGNDQIGMDAKSVHRGFHGTTTIDRRDFGLSWNGLLKSGDAALGYDVKIELNLEAVRQ